MFKQRCTHRQAPWSEAPQAPKNTSRERTADALGGNQTKASRGRPCLRLISCCCILVLVLGYLRLRLMISTTEALTLRLQHSISISSGSSSRAASHQSSKCTCLRADPTALRKHCSVKDSGWPESNEQLVNRCFDFLTNNASQYLQMFQHDPSSNISCTQQLLMHTYWAGPMTWKLKAVIQAFLFTHYSADTTCRPKPVLTVWLQTVEPTRALLEQWAGEWDAPYFLCSDQLQFRQWPPGGWLEELPQEMLPKFGANTTNLDRTMLQEAIHARAAVGNHVSYSDAMRFLVLYKFGGIYIDADVLILRNLEPFTHYDFLYEWSFVKEGMNTAVFGVVKGSKFVQTIIQAALAAALKLEAASGKLTFNAGVFSSMFHPMAVLRRVPPHIAASLEALPSIPFDPIWLTFDARGGQAHDITHIHKVQTWQDIFQEPPAAT